MNLFSRFKKHLNQEFGGRYMGVVLEQVISAVPEFAKAVWPKLDSAVVRAVRRGNAEVTCEYYFNDNKRRADVAIVEEGELKAVAEIKYEDHNNHGTGAQIDDYIELASSSKIPFSYVTQFSPPAADLEKLRASCCAQHVFYRALYDWKHKKNSSDIYRMFQKFLEEDGMVYRKNINEAALKLLIIKSTALKHAHGFGRKVSEENVRKAPEVLATLTDNAITLGDWFRSIHKVRECFSQSFRPSFNFSPCLYVPNKKRFVLDAEEKLEKDWLSVRELPDKYKIGGTAWFGVGGRLISKTGYIGIYIGYFFDATATLSGKKAKIDSTLDFEIKGLGARYASQVKIDELLKEKGLSENKAHNALVKAAKMAIEDALGDKDCPFGADVIKRLKSIQEGLQGLKTNNERDQHGGRCV